MKRKRNLWIFIGVIVLIAALVSGFVLMQPSAENILVQTLETTKTITDGHAVVAVEIDTLEEDVSGTVEVWAKLDKDAEEHPMGAFRVEILETSEEKAQGAVIVSDGETLWAYQPFENKVFVGTLEEAKTMMEENESLAGEFSKLPKHHDGEAQPEHPETSEEVVAKLLEYFNVSKSGSETLAGEKTHQLKLAPIPEQMPDEYIAVGGFFNLSIGQESNLPVAMSYTGGSMGEFNATVLEFNVNNGIDEALFTFEIPEGAEIVTFADLEPQSLTLEEAVQSSEFGILTPTDLPSEATLVDILEARGAIVQRYNLPTGGSFTVAQGPFAENADNTKVVSEGQAIEIRGTTGNLLVSEDGAQVLLTWIENGIFYSIAGDLTPEQATSVAESLQ